MSKIITAVKNKDFNYLSTISKNDITQDDIKNLRNKYKNNPWRYYILSIKNGDINLLKTAIQLTKTVRYKSFSYVNTIDINEMDEECIYFLCFNYISKIIKNFVNLYSFSKKYGKILLKCYKKIYGSYFFNKIYPEKNIFEIDFHFLKKIIKINNRILEYLNKNILRFFYYDCLNNFWKYDYDIDNKSKFYFKKNDSSI